MGNFSELCPHCLTKIKVQGYFEANDYGSEFTFDCPECGKDIHVDVHSVPEFELSKPSCGMCGKTVTGKRPYCESCQGQLLRKNT